MNTMKVKNGNITKMLVIMSILLVLGTCMAGTRENTISGVQDTTSYEPEFVPTRVTPSGPNDFVSTWNTANAGASGANEVRLPLYSGGTYNFTADWGDGTNDTITAWNAAAVTHAYASAGTYTITINGTIHGWCFNNGGDRLKIIEISQWGDLRLGNSGGYFYGCNNLVLSATDAPDLIGTMFLTSAFRGCTSLGSSGNMSAWDVSGVTRMDGMFYQATSFDQAIGGWDVSAVTDMQYMFHGASAFNRDIGGWNVSGVTDMRYMFYQASSFNQSIGGWDVSGVTNMQYMFHGASAFNRDISGWDVSNVMAMDSMFLSVTLSTANYDALLLGWSQLSLQASVNFHGGNSQYSHDAIAARAVLTTTFGWTITDGGPAFPAAPVLTIETSSPTISTTIELTWTSSPTASEYIVYRHSSAITVVNLGDATVVNTTAGTAFNDTVPGIGTYWYAVVATNPYGSSEPSNSMSIVVEESHGDPGIDGSPVPIIAAASFAGIAWIAHRKRAKHVRTSIGA